MILNKITVGNKLVLEIDHDPTIVNTPAPIGSQALRNNAGTGQAYLKFGVSDVDWQPFQVGTDTAGWIFASAIAGLNESFETRYFGTKAGNFDIQLVRNSEMIIALEQTRVKFNKNIYLDIDGGISEAQITATTNLYLNAPSIRKVANSHVETISSGQVQDRKYMNEELDGLANGVSVTRPSDTGVNTQSLMKVIIMLIDPTDSSKYAIWEKSYRMFKDSSEVVSSVIVQDDLTARNGVGNLRASVTISDSVVQVSYANIPDANNYRSIIKVEETVQRFS